MAERQPDSFNDCKSTPRAPVTLLVGATGVGAQLSATFEFGQGVFLPAAGLIALAAGGELVRRFYRRIELKRKENTPMDDWPARWWRDIK